MFTCNFFSYNMFVRFIHVAWTRTSLWTTEPDFHPDLPCSVDRHLPSGVVIMLLSTHSFWVQTVLQNAPLDVTVPLVIWSGSLGFWDLEPRSNDISIFSSTIVRWNPGRVSRLQTKRHCDLAAVCCRCHCPPFFVSTGPQSYFRPLCGRPGPGCWIWLPSLKTRRSSLDL